MINRRATPNIKIRPRERGADHGVSVVLDNGLKFKSLTTGHGVAEVEASALSNTTKKIKAKPCSSSRAKKTKTRTRKRINSSWNLFNSAFFKRVKTD